MGSNGVQEIREEGWGSEGRGMTEVRAGLMGRRSRGERSGVGVCV